ncbi:MAG: hypothetical protein CM1200mP2_55380 [Planctomycetaceae bacterium]|nr:MAG: hypothetical protein CM1200mP2_55380 [Planctomycetaceae bacterium]
MRIPSTRAASTGRVYGRFFPAFPQLTTSSLTSIEIIGGEGDNLIDLSAIDSTVFTALTSIDVRAGGGR